MAYLLAKYHHEYGEVLSFGAGDSKADAPFLALCDYALVPKNMQLGRELAVIEDLLEAKCINIE